MAKLTLPVVSVSLLVALQVGCAATTARPVPLAFDLPAPRLTCDTSIGVIHLGARLRNVTGRDIAFHLVGDEGPRLNPWYMGARVHSSAPGEPFRLVHNAGYDSEWTRTVAIAPGDFGDFNVPLFGLRPEDYRRYFRIELRDAKGRSYWTPPFELCAVVQTNCGCPQPGALSLDSGSRKQFCAAAPVASVAATVTQLEIGAHCQ